MDSDGDDELNRRRATNIINEPLLTGGQDVETIDERITCLERELAAGKLLAAISCIRAYSS